MKKYIFISFFIIIIIFVYYIVCLGGIYRIDLNYILRKNKSVQAIDIKEIKEFVSNTQQYDVILSNKSEYNSEKDNKLNDLQKAELANLLKNVILKHAIYSPGGRAIGEQYYEFLCIRGNEKFYFGISKSNTRFLYSGNYSLVWEDIYETTLDYRDEFLKFYN